jgi:hypothetical protein
VLARRTCRTISARFSHAADRAHPATTATARGDAGHERTTAEGKTTTACNPAMALSTAARGPDHRRRYAPARPALSPAIDQRSRPSQALTAGPRPRRDSADRRSEPAAITAGRTPPNPSELLSPERMKTLLTNSRTACLTGSSSIRCRCSPSPTRSSLAPSVDGITFVAWRRDDAAPSAEQARSRPF